MNEWMHLQIFGCIHYNGQSYKRVTIVNYDATRHRAKCSFTVSTIKRTSIINSYRRALKRLARYKSNLLLLVNFKLWLPLGSVTCALSRIKLLSRVTSPLWNKSIWWSCDECQLVRLHYSKITWVVTLLSKLFMTFPKIFVPNLIQFVARGKPLKGHKQCDQIGRFFAFWATIQSWWQQLFYPNHPHC